MAKKAAHLILNFVTGIDLLHSEYNLAGKDVKIGIIDSGISYSHDAFKKHFPSTSKTAYSFDFVGDYYDGTNVPPSSGYSVMDCKGSGTNIAGIIGGLTKTFSGIAPQATLGIYRVFGCKGTTEAKYVLKALNKAVEHGMNIIVLPTIVDTNDSIKELKRAIDKAAKNNVIIIAPTLSSSHNVQNQHAISLAGSSVISVGGVEIPNYIAHWFWLNGSSRTRILYQHYCNYMKVDTGKAKVELVNVVLFQGKCIIQGDISGNVLLVMNLQCSDKFLAMFAKTHNAKGISPIRMFRKKHVCEVPIFSITMEDALLIKQHIQGNANTQLEFLEETGQVNEADKVRINTQYKQQIRESIFLSPEFMAPGINLFTTFPYSSQSYGYDSSPSAPVAYTAGVVALILDMYRDMKLDVWVINSLLQNTARPISSTLDGVLESVLYQGAGMINAYSATHATFTVKPSVIRLSEKLELINGLYHHLVQPITIHNTKYESQKYRIFHRAAATICNSDTTCSNFDPSQYKSYAAIVGFSQEIVEVPAKQKVIVYVNVIQPLSLPSTQNWLYSGYIVVDPYLIESKTPSNYAMHIPYVGLKPSH
ncbi:peptidase S8/S53 domain-containing protein [Syncephalis fuscata]|nr:peptidase S8/S53 domain-containing protein [Syncephalis fuscata]